MLFERKKYYTSELTCEQYFTEIMEKDRNADITFTKQEKQTREEDKKLIHKI